MSIVDLPTTKRLFAVSNNLCAFEDCATKLVTDDGVVVGRICHIKGARRGAPRYDAGQPDAERHGFENLLLLCGPHHDVIDKEKSNEWTAARLRSMKTAHEATVESHPPDEGRVCEQLMRNTTLYEQGIRVGTVHAHTVQMAQGDIHNYPAAPPKVEKERQTAPWEEVRAKMVRIVDARQQDTRYRSAEVHVEPGLSLHGRDPRSDQPPFIEGNLPWARINAVPPDKEQFTLGIYDQAFNLLGSVRILYDDVEKAWEDSEDRKLALRLKVRVAWSVSEQKWILQRG